tara:strand:+ start:655 stop:1740 length:1086 start_codon:yes stop_codon:yes gene_type:complete
MAYYISNEGKETSSVFDITINVKTGGYLMTKLKQKQRKMKQQKANLIPTLWSVPTPKHNLPSINGKVRLYHFTKPYYLGSILEHGIIRGDTIANPNVMVGYNCPNLTSENKFHNPANIPSNYFQESDYIRLEVYFDEDDKNIINYGWFDKTYVKNTNRKIIEQCNREGRSNGNIDKQFLYKGEITPSMIWKISKWNKETGYWDRLSKQEILNYCRSYDPSALSFNGINQPCLDLARLSVGHLGNKDFTGVLANYFKKTASTEVLSPTYELNDKIFLSTKGKDLQKHRENLFEIYQKQDHSTLVNYIANRYFALLGNSVQFYSVQSRQHAINAFMREQNQKLEKFAEQQGWEIQNQKQRFVA